MRCRVFEQLRLFADNRRHAVLTPLPQKTYLSVRHVADRLDVSPNTIWRWTSSNPEFPKPVKLGPGCTRWRLREARHLAIARLAEHARTHTTLRVNGGVKSDQWAEQNQATCGAHMRAPGGRSPSGGLMRARRFLREFQPAFRARLCARR